MDNNYSIDTVDIQDLYRKALVRQREGFRLVQICATAFEGYNELIYSFAKEYEMRNYKIVVPIDMKISTISDFYPSAMLFENEIKELFGVQIGAINPDYQDKFFRIKAKTPFKKEVKDAIKIVKNDEEEAK